MITNHWYELYVSISILQLQAVSCNSELQSLLMKEEYAFISECGYLKAVHLITQQDVPAIIQVICLDYLIVRSSHEMAQFLEGMDELKMVSLLKCKPLAMKKLFVHDITGNIAAQDILRLFKPLLSPEGSNVRDEEEAVFINWTDYVQGKTNIILVMCIIVLRKSLPRNRL